MPRIIGQLILAGSRYQEKQQFSPNPKMERSAQGGFVSEGTGYLGRTSIEFQPPCRVRCRVKLSAVSDEFVDFDIKYHSVWVQCYVYLYVCHNTHINILL